MCKQISALIRLRRGTRIINRQNIRKRGRGPWLFGRMKGCWSNCTKPHEFVRYIMIFIQLSIFLLYFLISKSMNSWFTSLCKLTGLKSTRSGRSIITSLSNYWSFKKKSKTARKHHGAIQIQNPILKDTVNINNKIFFMIYADYT